MAHILEYLAHVHRKTFFYIQICDCRQSKQNIIYRLNNQDHFTRAYHTDSVFEKLRIRTWIFSSSNSVIRLQFWSVFWCV